jgi:succinate dehydrogenase/fumarate reductase flavoprotein subunit
MQTPEAWDVVVDVVVVGGGPGGLIAALAAAEEGVSVGLIEQNYDIGGRTILSGGRVYLGGGTAMQRRCGIQDSPEVVFRDWTRADHPLGRYNDRELVWTYARTGVAIYDYLEAHGVLWEPLGGANRIDSVPRHHPCAEWPDRAGQVIPGMNGSGLIRPLAAAARRRGVTFLMRHRMREVYREGPRAGAITGVRAEGLDDDFRPTGDEVRIRARKGVVLATGGHSMNVAFRRMFDPRLTEEYQTDAMNWSPTRADGELAGLAIGAALGAVANQTNEADGQLSKGRIACRSNYHGLVWSADSPHFRREGATGLVIGDYQNVILVKENGLRFHDETCDERDYAYFAAAMAWTGDPRRLNGGGPIWAIFDRNAVARERWLIAPPHVDRDGYFFQADSLEGLAAAIRNPYQWRPMPPEALRRTVDRYNGFVDAGADADFSKPRPRHRIETPPFFAAWSTPCLHDSYGGLRIDVDARVLDMAGGAIPGLYATGDCTGGFSQHGIGKAFVFGLIGGRHAASRPID